MPTLPEGQSLLVRTHFADDAAWAEVLVAAGADLVRQDGSDALTFVTLVDDADYRDLPLSDIVDLADSAGQGHVFVVDRKTCEEPEHPILVIRVKRRISEDENIATFRTLPSQLAAIESNLSIANLDFEDFSSAVGADGVFRGFAIPESDRTISNEQLIEATRRSAPTPALLRFRQDLTDQVVARWQLVTKSDLRADYGILAANNYGTNTPLGYEEVLGLLRDGGPGLGLHIPLPFGYWTAYLDVGSSVLSAAMFVEYPRSQ